MTFLDKGGGKMDLLKETLSVIKKADEDAMKVTRDKWDGLVKPIGSLGALEEATIKISGMTGKTVNPINRTAIVVMCSDNGVCDEGVSAAPQFFTKVLAESMSKGLTGVATLGKFSDTDIITVDLGIIGEVKDNSIVNWKISHGTANFTISPAMSYDQAVSSIEAGIKMGDMLYELGYDIIGTGEVGIGNTTTSAAVMSVLTGLDVDVTCGMGAGLTNEQHSRKKETIRRGISVNNPLKDDPIDVISKVGGYDIGGMCGMFLSAAKNGKPIVMDGFISSVAALCAVKLNHHVIDYILPSHLSKEPGSKLLMDELGLTPMLNLGMRLGEGSGCPLAFNILKASMYTLENMGTFQAASLSSEELIDIREK